MAAGDYSALDLMRAMRAAGFQYNKGLITGFAVSTGENTARDLTVVFVNTDGSRDRGPWQINDKFHGEVTDACAFNLACSCKEALRISNGGASFSPWSAYKNGRYLLFMELGYTTYALDNALQQVDTLNAKVATLTGANASLTNANLSLRSQLDTANAQVAKLQAQVTAMQATLDSANAEVVSLAAANAALQTQLDAANAETATVKAELDTIRTAATDARSILSADAAVTAKATLDAVL